MFRGGISKEMLFETVLFQLFQARVRPSCYHVAHPLGAGGRAFLVFGRQRKPDTRCQESSVMLEREADV